MDLEELKFEKLSKKRKKYLEQFIEHLSQESRINWGLNDSMDYMLKYLYIIMERGIRLIGILNEEIVCFGQLTKITSEIGYIEGVVVRTDLERKGIGTKLMNELEKIARKKKFKILYLDVNKGNLKGINFYKKLGYSSSGDSIQYLKMEKKLDA